MAGHDSQEGDPKEAVAALEATLKQAMHGESVEDRVEAMRELVGQVDQLSDDQKYNLRESLGDDIPKGIKRGDIDFMDEAEKLERQLLAILPERPRREAPSPNEFADEAPTEPGVKIQETTPAEVATARRRATTFVDTSEPDELEGPRIKSIEPEKPVKQPGILDNLKALFKRGK